MANPFNAFWDALDFIYRHMKADADFWIKWLPQGPWKDAIFFDKVRPGGVWDYKVPLLNHLCMSHDFYTASSWQTGAGKSCTTTFGRIFTTAT